MHRLTPPVSSLKHSHKDKFSINVFAYEFEDIKPQTSGFVNEILPIFLNMEKVFSVSKKHLTFLCGHAIVTTILKCVDEDGMNCHSCREPEVAAIR